MIEEHELRTVLAVMNITAPFEMVWCAQNTDPGDFARELYDVRDGYRFYLVPDNSALLSEDGVISAR